MKKKLSLLFVAVVLAFAACFTVACKNVDLPQEGDKQHVVTYYYNYDGAPNSGVYRTDKVTDNNAAEKPNDPTRTGYAFKEWTTDTAGDKSYVFSALVKSDLKLYAQWTDNGVESTLSEIVATVAKTYMVGDTVAKSDITVTAKYDNGTEKTVTDFEFTSPDTSTVGKKQITVTYGGKTTTVEITVTDGEPMPALIRIEVTPPTKTTYFVGEELDLTGMVVTAVYSDGEGDGVKEPLSSDAYEVSGYDKTKTGTQKITVTYKANKAVTADFGVTVNAPVLSKIEITAKPTKLLYTEGEELDLTGMVVTAYYSDDSSEIVTEYTISGYDKDGIREQTVTVTYEGKRASFKVTVKAADVVRYNMSFVANIADNFADKIADMPGAKIVEQNSTTAQPDNPTLKGFTFDGWYKEAACTDKWNFATDKVTADVTLYAKWTAKSYTVTYNLNNGANGANPATYKATDGDVTLKVATRDYHTFDGWYTAQTDGADVEKLTYDLIPEGATTEIKLYARFTANTYNINYVLGGSESTYTATLSESAPKQYVYGKTTTLPGVDDVEVVTADGVDVDYIFMSWYVHGDDSRTEVDNTSGMNGDKTFVALIEQKTAYTFTFDYGYDHNADGKQTYSRNIVEGEKAIYRNLTELCNRVGYTFDGWYTDRTWTTEYDFNTPVTADSIKTIYAKWTEIKYVISYVGDGVTTTNPTTYKVTDGEVTLDTEPTLAEGYYFDGWFFDSAYGEAAVRLEENILSYAVADGGVSTITVYAKSGNEYNVKYNSNKPAGVTESTSGKPDDTTVVYGNAIAAPTTTPSLSDYAFLGWYTDVLCTDAWDFETEVNNSTAAFDKNHTFNLYARWYQKATSGKYLVGNFNDWNDFDKRPDVAQYLAPATRTGKEWKITNVTLKAGDTFKFIDYDKATNNITWNDPYAQTVCIVRPEAAMTITCGAENYEVNAYALGEGRTWTIEFGTNGDGANYITFTLDGYIDWRDPMDGSPENPSEDLELENGVWYLVGNFTYWFNASDSWSTKNAFSHNSNNYMFTNVYLKKYDTFKIRNSGGIWLGGTFEELGTPFGLSSGNAPDIKLDTIDDGYYNIVFNRAENKLTINNYVPVTIELKADKTIYVDDELKNDAATKGLFTVTANGGALAAGEYTVVQSTAVAGENTLIIIYKGGVFTYTYVAKEPQIVGISIDTAPTQKWYFVGDELNTAGLKIKLDYDKTGMDLIVTDAELFDVTANLVGVTTGELRRGNEVTVTVALKANPKLTATFKVNVLNKVTSIAVTDNPTKMTYFAGDALDTTGLEVTVYFNGGTTLSTVTADINYKTTPANGATLTTSNNKITVKYTQPKPEGCTLTMPSFNKDITGLTVNEPQIVSVRITGSLNTDTYKVGDTFAANGLAFTATKDNGDTVTLNATDMTFTIASEYADNANMFIKAGDVIPVTVKYGDITATGVTVTVTVDNRLTSIKVDPSGLIKPHSAGFVEGDALTVNGIAVTPVYNEGIVGATVVEGNPVNNYTVTPALGTELSAGGFEVTVKYSNLTAAFTITVVERQIVGLTVDGAAAQQYMSGTFNASGLTFKALFNDDTDEVVPAANITFTCTAAMSGSGTFTVAGDHTMTATYEGATCTFPINVANSSGYTVEFAINIPGSGKVANNMPDSTNVNHNTLVTEPTETPTLKGYTFGGWYKEAACTNVWDFATDKVTDNISIYAKWISKTYTIDYYVDGAVFGTPDTYTATANLYPNDFALKTAEKTGFEFKGWCMASNLGGTPINHMTYARLPENEGDGATPQTISLYAKFEVLSYTVKFIANGDEVDEYGQTVEYNEKATKPATDPTRAYYDFAFWSEDGRDVEDAAVFDFANTSITGDVTLYAHWEAIYYTVDYKLNDGTNHADNPETYSITDASSITLKNPSKSGYRFIEWQYKDAKVTALTHDMLPDNKTDVIELTAVFEQIVYYTVSFDLNYDVATGVDKVTEVSVEKGQKATKPANPERTNWTFKGWFLDDAEYLFTEPVTGDITLKAKWERQTVKITFDFNYTGAPDPVVKTVNKGEPAVAPADEYPTRDGWVLLGWFLDKDCTNAYTFPATSTTRTLYAKWQKLTGNYIVIGEEKYELTDNSNESVYHDIEYMIEGISLNSPDQITFEVDSSTVTLTVDTNSHGIASVNGTTVKITADGTYSFYLYKGNGDDVWTLFGTYAEYVPDDSYYLVGEFTGNDAHKWATVNPEFRFGADNTIIVDLEVGDTFKIAKANDDGTILWSGDLDYSNVVAADQGKVGYEGTNVRITIKGTYTLSVVDGAIHISIEGVEQPDPSTLAVGKYLVIGDAQPSADYKFTTLTPDTANNMTEQYTIEFELTENTSVKVWNQSSATSGSYVAFSELYINGVKQGSTANPTLPVGKYTVYYKVYTQWVRMEFVKQVGGDTTDQLIGTKFVLTGSDNKSITIYFANADGSAVTLGDYKMWAWTDAGNLLAEKWNDRPTLKAEMTSTKALGNKISFKFTKGSAESNNLEGVETDKTYVVTIDSNNQLTIKEYVAA